MRTELPTPEVNYTYTWPGVTGPVAYAVERGRDVDSTPVALTRVTIHVDAEGRVKASGEGLYLNKDGSRDKRHAGPKMAWVDQARFITAWELSGITADLPYVTPRFES